MSIREALFTHLRTTARSVYGDADVYPMGAVPKQPPFRFVTYQRISNVHVRHMTAGAGLAAPRYQVDVFARYAAEADAIAEAIRKSLDNLRGDFGDPGYETTLRASFLDNDDEEFVPPIDNSQVGRARVRMDFILWHNETVTPGI